MPAPSGTAEAGGMGPNEENTPCLFFMEVSVYFLLAVLENQSAYADFCTLQELQGTTSNMGKTLGKFESKAFTKKVMGRKRKKKKQVGIYSLSSLSMILRTLPLSVS